MSKRIPIGPDLFAIVDDEDFDRLCILSWSPLYGRNTVYVKRYCGTGRNDRRFTLMHHDVIGHPPIGFVTDHINTNGLDNRKVNLQFLSNKDNTGKADRIINAKSRL